MKYLFIDTSNGMLSMAILDNSKILIEKSFTDISEQSKYALFEMSNMFNEVNTEPSDINKIFVINGPGSFTGIRIGITIAKTYAWSLKIPVIPISSLKAYALSYDNSDYYISVIDARRNNVYAGIYDKNYHGVIDETHVSIDKLNDIINALRGDINIIGNIDISNFNKSHPIKLNILKIVEYYKNEKNVNAHELKPNYLKKVEAEEKLAS